MLEPENNEPDFSLQDFKKWMSENARQSFAVSKTRWKVGTEVEPNIGFRKLVNRMEPTEGDVTEMAKEFKQNGGLIAEVDGLYSRIEVINGSFVVPSNYVRARMN